MVAGANGRGERAFYWESRRGRRAKMRSLQLSTPPTGPLSSMDTHSSHEILWKVSSQEDSLDTSFFNNSFIRQYLVLIF